MQTLYLSLYPTTIDTINTMDTIHIEKRTFPVLDMSCAACAVRVDKTLNGQPGVRTASVNYAAATATVEYDTAQCSPEQLKAALQAAGYDLLVGDDRKQLEDRAEQAHDEKYRRLRQRTVWAIILALPVAVIGMFFMHMPYADLISWALSTPIVLWLGRDFHRNAWRQLRHGTANMDTLVSNSTLIAYVFSLFNMLFPEFWTARGVEPHVYFEAASVIIAFILLGRLLEERAKGSTSTAIRKLMGLQPRTVTIVNDRGETREISIDDLQRGQTVSVRPGERIAVDGIIVAGSSYIDESMLSGEPVPVAKREGSHVFAGTINDLLGYFTVICLLRSVVTFIAVFKLRKMPDYKPTYKMPCWQLMALLAVVPTMILLVSTFVWAPGQSMIAAVVAVGTGYPVYLYFKKQNNITAHTGK